LVVLEMVIWLQLLLIVSFLSIGFGNEKLSLQVDITKDIKCSDLEKASKGDKVKKLN